MILRLELEVTVPDSFIDGRAGSFAQHLYDTCATPAELVADWFVGPNTTGTLTIAGPTQGSRLMSWRARGRWTKPRRY